MSYIERERSDYLGAPIELYKLSRGATTYYYTSGDTAVTYDGNNYVPTAIRRSGLLQQADGDYAPVNITVARDNEIAILFRGGSIQTVVAVTIFRVHRDDADVLAIFTGVIRGAAWSGSEAVLEARSINSYFKRQICRHTYQTQCNHKLFDSACTVLRSDWDSNQVRLKQTVILTGVDGAQLYADEGFWAVYLRSLGVGGEPEDYDNFFTAGTAVDEITGERRFITVHNGDSGGAGGNAYIRVRTPFSSLEVGSELTCYAGCMRTIDVCQNKFSNQENFGGYVTIPNINPFIGGVR